MAWEGNVAAALEGNKEQTYSWRTEFWWTKILTIIYWEKIRPSKFVSPKCSLPLPIHVWPTGNYLIVFLPPLVLPQFPSPIVVPRWPFTIDHGGVTLPHKSLVRSFPFLASGLWPFHDLVRWHKALSRRRRRPMVGAFSYGRCGLPYAYQCHTASPH